MALTDIVKELNKKYKNNNLVLKASVVPTFTRLQSLAFGLTYVTYGGFAEGTVTEMSGVESSGKTTCAMLTVADCQRKYPNKYCVYIDIETFMDIDFQGKMNNIDLDRLYYVRPTQMSGEQILDMAIEFLKDPECGLLVLDSLPALLPQIVWENDLTKDAGMRATMARKLFLFYPMARSLVSENKSMLIVINQVREEAKQFGGKTLMVQKETCGWASKFFCDTIIRFGKKTFTLGDNMDYSEQKKDQGEGADGFRIKFKIIKNKTAKVARGGGFITYRYATGIDWLHDLLEIALSFDFIKRINNSQYALVDIETGEILKDENGKDLQGFKKVLIEYLKTHKEFCNKYVQKLVKYVSESSDSYGMLVDTSDIDEEQRNVDRTEKEDE